MDCSRVSDDESANGWCISSANRLDAFDQRIVAGAEVHKQELIVTRMQERTELRTKGGQFTLVQLAEEHAVLDVVAVSLQGAKDKGPAFVVRDVVGHEVVAAGHVQRVVMPE